MTYDNALLNFRLTLFYFLVIKYLIAHLLWTLTMLIFGMTGVQLFMQVFLPLGKETKQKNESNNYIRSIHIWNVHTDDLNFENCTVN